MQIDSLEIQIQSSAQKANQEIDKLIANIGKLASALKIDTSGLEKIGKSLNFSGIDKASKAMQSKSQKVSKSLSQITEQYKDLGKGFEFKGSMPALKKQIDSYSNALEKAKLKMQELEVSENTGGKGYENAIRDVMKYENILESLNKQLSDMQEEKVNVDFKITGIENAENQISDISEKLKTSYLPQSAFNYNADAMKAVFGEMASEVENWSQAIGRFGLSTGTILNQASSETDGLKEKTRQFEESLKSLRIPAINTENIKTLQRELSKSENEFDKLRAKLENGIAMGRISPSVDDKNFRSLKEQMYLAEKQAEALREKIGQVQQTSGQTSSGAKKLGASISSASNSFFGLANSASKAIKPLNSLGNTFKSLLRAILPILGIRQLFRWGKQSVETASDLTEVQNVVDSTFGDMAYKLENFSDASIEKFGMSALAAKQYASQFQAMGTAMGFPTGEMSDMSMELTKLTADMASFYNVEQKAVAEDLQSIFTGATRPLRQYGLDLTQATLQEWALKQGIDANVKSMSQAEKTMLRYQYVMSNTGAAQGDFARTANTWANSVRVLKQNLQQLASVIGGVFINALKPLVSGLNSVIKSVTTFAKTVADALGTIFGWTIEISGGGLSGVADDFEDAAGASGGMADGTGAAADNLKKMQKYIAPWHEVNVMESPEPSSGGGGGAGGGGGGGGGAADGAQSSLVRMESIFDKYKSQIDTLYKLGAYIGDALSDAMESIGWDSIYEKARNFGKGLADFLNGLISPRLFRNVGETIAGGLNTALEALNTFGETFDWGNFGKSIAAGINGFFKKFNFRLLAKTLNTWAKGLLDSMIEAVSKVKWGEIGRKIGQFLADLDFKGVVSRMANLLWKAINAALKTYSSLFNAAPIETTLLTVFAALKFTKLGSVIAKNIFDAIKDKINPYLTQFASHFKGEMAGAIGVALTAFAEFGIVFDSFKKMGEGVRSFGDEFMKLAGTITAAGAIMTKVIGFPAGLIATGIVGLIGAIGGFASGVEEAERQLAESEEMQRYGDTVANLNEKLQESTQALRDRLEESKEYVESAGVAEANMAKDLADRYFELAEKQNRTNEETEEMKTLAGQLAETFPQLESFYNDQTGLLEGTEESIRKVIDAKLEEIKLNAYQEEIGKIYEEQAKHLVTKAKNEKAYKDAINESTKAQENYNKAVELSDALQKYQELQGQIERTAGDTSDLQAEQDKYNKILQNAGINAADYYTAERQIGDMLSERELVLQKNKSQWEETIKIYEDAEQAIADTDEQIAIINDEIAKTSLVSANASKDAEESIKNLPEFQQQLKNTTHELSQLGDGFANEFVEKLTVGGESMRNSVIETLRKLKDGAEVPSDELKTLFGNIAPGMADTFIESLSAQEPEMQMSVARILGNMASGAQVSKSDLETVFSAMGLSVPQAAIEAFAQQEPLAQAEAMKLFSNMENGAGIAAVSVQQAFAAFGYQITNDGLISAIGEMDGPAQQSMIALLLELPNATGERKSEIISKLSEDTDLMIDDGVIKPIEDGMADAADAAESGGVNVGKSGGVGIGNGGRFTLSAANTLDKNVVNTFAKSKAPQTANKKGAEAGKQYSSGISSQNRNVISSSTGILNSSTGVFRGIGTTFGGFGTTAISSMASSIAVSVGLVTVQMTAVMTALTAQFKNIGNQFSEIGKTISSSLGNGISSASGVISNSMSGIIQSMSSMASSLYDIGRSAGRNFANGFQSIRIPTPHISISGSNRERFAGSTIALPKFNVRWYAAGGFPEDGWFRANHGEIMGKFDNGQSVVANNQHITEGISAAVQEGNRENNMLMRQEISLLRSQNDLLNGILKKETGISYKDVFKAAKKGAREEFRRTGSNGLVF